MGKLETAQWEWKVIQDVMVAFGTYGAMPDEEWKKCINDLDTKPVKKWLVAVLGTMDVSSVQRKLGIDAINRKNIRVALVSDDRIVRGLLTAASWFGVNGAAFAWRDLEGAVAYLGVPRPVERLALAAVRQFKGDADPSS